MVNSGRGVNFITHTLMTKLRMHGPMPPALRQISVALSLE
jgi:hypothetical protein